MSRQIDVSQVAEALLVSVSLLVRRARQIQDGGELTLPERSALSRLDRGGPTTSAALARREQISPQSMGATLGGLEDRGLIERNPDPEDGRRVVLSVTDDGHRGLSDRRNAKTQRVSDALASSFEHSELEQLWAAAALIERLAETL